MGHYLRINEVFDNGILTPYPITARISIKDKESMFALKPFDRLEVMYDELKNNSSLSFIFSDTTFENMLDPLSWLTTKLVSEHRFVAVVQSIADGLIPIVANSIICKIDNFKQFKYKKDQLKGLAETDILYIETEDIKNLLAIRKFAIENELKCKLVYEAGSIDPKELIYLDVNDIYKVEEPLIYAH